MLQAVLPDMHSTSGRTLRALLMIFAAVTLLLMAFPAFAHTT